MAVVSEPLPGPRESRGVRIDVGQVARLGAGSVRTHPKQIGALKGDAFVRTGYGDEEGDRRHPWIPEPLEVEREIVSRADPFEPSGEEGQRGDETHVPRPGFSALLEREVLSRSGRRRMGISPVFGRLTQRRRAGEKGDETEKGGTASEGRHWG